MMPNENTSTESAVWSLPPGPETVCVMTKLPGVVYRCEGFGPVAVLPSPKSQAVSVPLEDSSRQYTVLGANTSTGVQLNPAIGCAPT